jgi:large subunit ribosomal protein L19e
MSDLSLQRRLAAKILKAGRSRVYINPEYSEDVAEAITKDDVRSLIKQGKIELRPPSTPSRGRKRRLKVKKSRGKRKGHGSRKGASGARTQPDTTWVHRVRKQRKYLRELYIKGEVDKKTYRTLYLKIKGGVFPSVSSLRNFLAKRV